MSTQTADSINIFKAIREAAGMTQVELAAVLDVDQSAISQYERARRVPRTDIARRYVEFARKRNIRHEGRRGRRIQLEDCVR